MDTAERKVLVFTATYNEQSNIEPFVRKVFAVLPHCDLMIVDDASPDGTGTTLDRLAKEHPNLKPIHRPAKLGLGSAHKLGMLHAMQNGYDVLLTLDADFSHDPDDLPRLLKALENADYVTGSRYAAGGISDYVGYRRFVSIMGNWSVRALLGTRLKEATTSLRGYSAAVLRTLPFDRIRSDGYSFFLETFYWIAASKNRCCEIPIHFHNRTAGVSKIPKLQILFGMMTLLVLFLNRVFRRSTPAGEFTPPREHHCYNCQSVYLVEKYKPTGEQKANVTTVRCTSMGHHNKPQVIQCLACGLCYVPRTHYADQEMLQLYADTEDLTYLEHKDARRKTFNRVLRVTEPFLPAPGTMLELGSYCGLFLEVARDKGWTTTGLEPSHWAARHARETLNLDVRQGTLDDHKAGFKQPYNAVVAWDVLEHLEDPTAELRKIHSVLDENGVFCFSTLDIENWFPRLAGRRWPWIMDMHLFYFSRTTLTHMLKKAGFELVTVIPYCHYISVSYLFLKLCALVFKGVNPKTNILARWLPTSLFIPFRFGDIKLFVCRKVAHSTISSDITAAKLAA